MNPIRRDGVQDEPQPEEEASGEVLIPRINIPPGSDHQRMFYLARVAEMFYILSGRSMRNMTFTDAFEARFLQVRFTKRSSNYSCLHKH